jgi:hypothetical protein
MTDYMKMGRKIGAAIGGVLFLIFGIPAGFYFGSYGAVVVMHHLLGPVEAGVLVRIAVVVGSVLGLFCTAAVSVVLGAVFGTAVGYVTELFTAPSKAKEETTAEAKH